MAATLFINIAQLVNVRDTTARVSGAALAHLPVIDDAFLLVQDGCIKEYGHMYELGLKLPQLPTNVHNVSGQYVLPAWCDSHTHLVFAGSREHEFVYKIKGLTYAQIAEKGGGILHSAKQIEQASEAELYHLASNRLTELSKLGTAAIEIKSGYGLTVASELKMLRVIQQLKQTSDMLIKATFLAHTYPIAFRNNHRGYIDSIINEMLPEIAAHNLADYIDVFCEEGFFSAAEMNEICLAGKAYGLLPKLHVNQLSSMGGIAVGIANHAVSLDHLETLTQQDIELLATYNGAATLLPTAAFFLRMPMQPARQLIQAGAAVTLASDYNPGSSPSGNMNFVTALSCIQMKMLPEEVINAATINGAYAMGVQQLTGSITIGKRADLIFTKKIPSIAYLFYSFSSNCIDKVMVKGHFVT